MRSSQSQPLVPAADGTPSSPPQPAADGSGGGGDRLDPADLAPGTVPPAAAAASAPRPDVGDGGGGIGDWQARGFFPSHSCSPAFARARTNTRVRAPQAGASDRAGLHLGDSDQWSDEYTQHSDDWVRARTGSSSTSIGCIIITRCRRRIGSTATAGCVCARGLIEGCVGEVGRCPRAGSNRNNH